MDWALILEAGQNDLRFSKPAIELQLSETIGPIKIGSFTRLALDNWNSQRFEVTVPVRPGLTLTTQYFTGTDGHGPDTVQFVSKTKVGNSPFTLTASYSPDAFGAGERYRVGAQVYLKQGDFSFWGWGTARYFRRFDSWDQESWYQMNYHLSDHTTLSLRRFDSDFFGDNLTIRATVRG